MMTEQETCIERLENILRKLRAGWYGRGKEEVYVNQLEKDLEEVTEI